MKLIQPSLIISSILIFISIAANSMVTAESREFSTSFGALVEPIEQSQSIRNNQQATATITIIVNLPIIEQNAPAVTPVPLNIDSPVESEADLNTSTPTPTPIPVQTGSVNLPIVFGALAIILVIILAWFFVGYLPGKNRQ